MTTITPPPTTVQPAPVPTTPPTAVAANQPPALSALVKGAMLPAKVITHSPPGIAQLQTSLGSFNVRTALALATGAKIELQLLRAGPPALFQVHYDDGTPLDNGSVGTKTPVRPPGQMAAKPGSSQGREMAQVKKQGLSRQIEQTHPATFKSRTAPAPLKLTAGSSIHAQFLEAPANSGSAVVKSRPGFDKFISTDKSPVASYSKSEEASVPIKSGPGISDTNSKAARAIRAHSNTLAYAEKASGFVNATILTITRPGQQPQKLGPTASGAGTAGTVIGSNFSGAPLVETTAGTLFLIGSETLPVGTKLRLDLKVPGPIGKLPLAPFNASGMAPAREWPSLNETFGQLLQTAPETTLSFREARFPQANNRLAANILIFLTALRGGDIRGWLGDLTRTLEQSQPELAGRLREDFAQAARIFNEGPQNDWRTTVVPMMNGETLESVFMHLRGQSPGAESEEAEDASRFLVDIELSRLGRVQLDGLVKSAGRTFDLIFRSEEPLPAYMRKDINRIYHELGEVSGFAGSLTFLARQPFVHVPLDYLDYRLAAGLMV